MKVEIPPLPSTPRTQQTKRLDVGFFPPTSLCSVPLFLFCSLSILSSPASLYVHKPSRSIFTSLLSIFAWEGAWQNCVHCNIFQLGSPRKSIFSDHLLPPSANKHREMDEKKCVALQIELIEALFFASGNCNCFDLHPNFFPPALPWRLGHCAPLFLGDPPVHPSS